MLNMERFSSTMREMNWDNVLHNSNVQDAYTMFYNEFCFSQHLFSNESF